jgi:hypothetical protein
MQPDLGTRQALPSVRPGAVVRLLIAATVALCCTAPLITLLSRSGTLPSDVYPIFLRLFAFNDYAGSLAMLLAFVLALAVPKLQQNMIRLAHWTGEHPGPIVAIAFVVLVTCSRLVYQAHPLSMDEYAPWMQANAFAHGDLAARYPTELLDRVVPPEFQGVFIGVDKATGDAISRYWPGLALSMTPFAWLNIGWCTNPAFGALALAMIYRLATDATGDRTVGGWSMLIALASPQFTVNAISYYAMPGELALNLVFLWLLLKPNLKSAFAAGLVGGLAMIMHNPAPHVLMALPCLLWMACDRQRWSRLMVALIGYLPLLAIGFSWAMLMSSMDSHEMTALRPAYQNAASGLVSFVASFLTLPDGPTLTARWYATWKMWIWACPGLLLVPFLPHVRPTCERLLLGGLATTYVFFLFVVFDQGHGWGYRYIHPAWAALPVAAGLWLASATEAARRFGGAMVAAGLLATPAFLWGTYGTIQEALSSRLDPDTTGDWLVFVSRETGRYRGDLVQNPPGQSHLLYLISHGDAKDRELLATYFPGAIERRRDSRGSAWHLPRGQLAKLLHPDSTFTSR